MDEKVYSIAQKWKGFPALILWAQVPIMRHRLVLARKDDRGCRPLFHAYQHRGVPAPGFLPGELCEHTGTVAFIDDANASMGRMKEALHYMCR